VQESARPLEPGCCEDDANGRIGLPLLK